MNCLNCQELHSGEYGSGKFCSMKCARSFSTKSKRKEINKKVSVIMTGKQLSDEHKKNIERSNNFNRKQKVSKHCVACNKQLICNPSDKRKYCSRQCWINDIEQNRTSFASYSKRCKFDFNVYEYPSKFNLQLIEEFGWYSATNRGGNLDGISRDHMLSVRYGFDMGIDPALIKHPANCELMRQAKNAKKRASSSITLKELLERIKNW
jgi:hypothetical protein